MCAVVGGKGEHILEGLPTLFLAGQQLVFRRAAFVSCGAQIDSLLSAGGSEMNEPGSRRDNIVDTEWGPAMEKTAG